jgi:Flp pilus assembly protein TadD
VLDFGRAVDALGYSDVAALERAGIDHDALESEAERYYRALLQGSPRDAAALNNLGVLLLNSGRRAEARRLLTRALALAANDRNIHENLSICDILEHRPARVRHVVPEAARPGRGTLVAYFDPHGM